MLEGGTTQLRELAEDFSDGDFSPASAWAAWRLVAEGLWFSGTPEAIQARTRQQVEVDQVQRGAKETAARDWADFLARLTAHQLRPEDTERLAEVERLTLGRPNTAVSSRPWGTRKRPRAPIAP